MQKGVPLRNPHIKLMEIRFKTDVIFPFKSDLYRSSIIQDILDLSLMVDSCDHFKIKYLIPNTLIKNAETIIVCTINAKRLKLANYQKFARMSHGERV